MVGVSQTFLGHDYYTVPGYVVGQVVDLESALPELRERHAMDVYSRRHWDEGYLELACFFIGALEPFRILRRLREEEYVHVLMTV